MSAICGSLGRALHPNLNIRRLGMAVLVPCTNEPLAQYRVIRSISTSSRVTPRSRARRHDPLDTDRFAGQR